MKTQITNDIKIIVNNKKFWRYQHWRLQVIPQKYNNKNNILVQTLTH